MMMYLFRMHVIFLCSVKRLKCFLNGHQYAKTISNSYSLNMSPMGAQLLKVFGLLFNLEVKMFDVSH